MARGKGLKATIHINEDDELRELAREQILGAVRSISRKDVQKEAERAVEAKVRNLNLTRWELDSLAKKFARDLLAESRAEIMREAVNIVAEMMIDEIKEDMKDHVRGLVSSDLNSMIQNAISGKIGRISAKIVVDTDGG